MPKSFCKIIVLFAFLSLCLCAQNSYAQAVEAMSAKDYAIKKLPDVKSFFGEGTPEVPCGDQNTKCNLKTEMCLRCSERSYELIGENTEFGFCVPKNYSDKDWSGKCESRVEWMWSWALIVPAYVPVYIEATINEEPYGFLKTSSRNFIGMGSFFEKKMTFKGSDGKTYGLIMDNTNLTISYGGEKIEGCEILPVKIYNMQKCFFCPMARMLFKTVNNITKTAFSYSAKAFSGLVIVVYAVWLAFVTLQQVYAFTSKDASEYIKMVLKQTFKVAIVYYLLLNSTSLFQYFISPVLGSGLKMGEMVQATDLFQPAKNLDENAPVMSSGYYNIKLDGGTLYEKIENYLSSVQGQLAYIQSVGSSVFCAGTGHLVLKLKEMFHWADNFATGFRMMGLGIILIISGMLISIVFAFYFLDALMELGLLGMMMPLMIAGWPFSITKHFAGKGLSFLMNVFFVFFFTGFVVSVNVQLINQSLTYSTEVSSENGTTGLNAITQALQNQNVTQLADATNIGGVGFLLLIFTSIFGFKFIKEVPPLAARLSGGGMGIDLASKMGTTVASQAMGAAKKASEPLQKSISKATANSGGLVGIASGGVGMLSGMAKSAANFGADVARATGNKKVGRALASVGKGFGAVQKGAKSAQNFAKKSSVEAFEKKEAKDS